MPKKQTEINADLDQMYHDALRKLQDETPGSDDYQSVLDQVNKLHKMREDNKPSRVDKNTMASIGANIAGILLVTHFEYKNVITSKAFSLISKLK